MQVSLAILGSDAVLAAQPATPIQLMHAARLAGFDVVLPASLGDELVADEALRLAQAKGRAPVLLCACPLAAGGTGDALDGLAVAVAPPAVALARAVRLGHGGAPLHVTYVGDCPGAVDPSIDLRVPAEAFLRGLAQRGIDPTAQPTEFTDRLPPDRRRFRSIAGGAPSPEAVEALLRRTLVVPVPRPHTDPRLQLADALLAGGATFVDPGPLFGCACAGAARPATASAGHADAARAPLPLAAAGAPVDGSVTAPGATPRGVAAIDAIPGRARLAALEPPRAPSPVVVADPALDLRPTRTALADAHAAARTPRSTTPIAARPVAATATPRPEHAPAPTTSARTRFALAAQARRRHAPVTPVEPIAPIAPIAPPSLDAPPIEREIPLVAHDADAAERATPVVSFFAGIVARPSD